MKDLLPIIIKEIKSSWYANQKEVEVEKVIEDLKKMKNLCKSDFLEKIGKKGTIRLLGFNSMKKISIVLLGEL